MKNETNPRAAAAASLISWEKNGRFANLEVNASLHTSSMSEADKGLYTALVYGIRLTGRPAVHSVSDCIS